MPSYSALKSAKNLVKDKLPLFGINKSREITRLLFEISKRDKISPSILLNSAKTSDFNKLKHYLLNLRFPVSYPTSDISRFYLPKIELDEENIVFLKDKTYYPEHIYYEKSAADSGLTKRAKSVFAKSSFSEIPSLKEHIKHNQRFSMPDYNKRRNTLFLVNQLDDYFKKCPCTKNAVGCNYHIFNLGFGCIFECTYCYLQEYTNSPGIVLSSNTERFFEEFSNYKKPKMRIGTGEFSDSLMLDNLTMYSTQIIKFLKNEKDIMFEFKTKSNNIENLLKANHSGNIVVSWSLNPQSIIDKNEFYSASLEERINSAKKCIKAGYKTGFHFDPVFYYTDWKKDYKKLIKYLFSAVKSENIAWISIGTFRFKPQLKKVIENRFPENAILDEELIIGYDNKLRYPDETRYNIYRCITDELLKYDKNLPVYLCMESTSMWKALKLHPVFL